MESQLVDDDLVGAITRGIDRVAEQARKPRTLDSSKNQTERADELGTTDGVEGGPHAEHESDDVRDRGERVVGVMGELRRHHERADQREHENR